MRLVSEKIHTIKSYSSLFAVLCLTAGYMFLRYSYSSFYDVTSLFLDFLTGYMLIIGAVGAYSGKKFELALKKYDSLAMRFWWYARAYPWTLLFFGVLLHIHTGILVVTPIVILVFSLQTYTITKLVRRKIPVPCASIGVVQKVPLSWVCIFQNILIIIVALIGFILSIF